MDRQSRRDLALTAGADSSADGSLGAGEARDCAVSAQVMGQTGRKRGLKGGPPVLSQAKTAYLETEWSGPDDRRIRPGRITRTQV